MLINNSNEFRPACGEDTGLDSLTGRFKRNCWTMVVIRLKQKLGHCSAIGHQSPATTTTTAEKVLMSQRFAKGGKFNGMLWECFGRVFVEHATLFIFFFSKCKIPWRRNERCWLGARPKVTVHCCSVVETVELERADDLPEIQKVNTRGTGCCGRWRCRCVKTLGVLFI